MGTRIARLRTDRDMSQTEAARHLGIKQPSLSAIESGVTKTINGKTMAMLCQTFNTTAEYIWFGAGDADTAGIASIEAEAIHMLRSLTPSLRGAAIASIRGIFHGQATRLKENQNEQGKDLNKRLRQDLGKPFHPKDSDDVRKTGTTDKD